MKKTEMVNIFDDSYDTWENDVEIWKSFDSYGDYLVHLAIEAGMLPPVALPPDFMHEELAMVNFLTNDLCVWEDEDE